MHSIGTGTRRAYPGAPADPRVDPRKRGADGRVCRDNRPENPPEIRQAKRIRFVADDPRATLYAKSILGDSAPPSPPVAVKPAEDVSINNQQAVPADLGALLLDSLRALTAHDSAAVLQGSQAGEELFRVVHGVPIETVAQQTAQVCPDTTQHVNDVNPFIWASKAPTPRYEKRAPVEQKTVDDFSDEEEGVPHRLPPGFGAIPEDLVEERARIREDQRMRAIRATQACRFGRNCKRRDCPNAHVEGREIDNVLNLCSFGKRCKRKNCYYDHIDGREIDKDPNKAMCKFGERCKRPDCLYDHPPNREPVPTPDYRMCFICHGSGHIAQDCPKKESKLAK